MIDKEGKIRLMHYSDLPSDIPLDEEILTLLDNLKKGKEIFPDKALQDYN